MSSLKINSAGIVKSSFASTRPALIAVALLSAVSNILMLVSPLFMMQVYDRVLGSRSIPTLIALSILALGIYAALAVIEFIRAKILQQIGRRLDEQLSEPTFKLILTLPLHAVDGNSASMPLRDLDQIRQFMSGPGPVAFLDLPWMPLYIGLLYLFHPLFGLAAIGGAIVLLALALVSELVLRDPTKRLAQLTTNRWELAEAGRRNADSLYAMGMRRSYTERYDVVHQKYIEENLRTSGTTASFGAVSKIFRLALQSGMLALGAGLVIEQQASPGAIIAASILTSKALSPIEVVIAQWRGFVNVRQSKRRLQDTLDQLRNEPVDTELPAPHRSLSVAGLAVEAPGGSRLIVQNVTLNLFAGQGLGIVGPSGSGKSSVARALTGIWPSARGSVRFDGAALNQWNPDALGRSIGYLPQSVELFDGTVAENICRFSSNASSEGAIEAARLAGVHDLVLSLPQGYDTRIGMGGAMLSGGQRQRIGLARALFGNPFLIVLDEPNANLDTEGETALGNAVMSARERGAIVILIAHRPNILQFVDHLMVINHGSMMAFGPRDQVFRQAVGHSGAEDRKTA